MLEIGEDAVEVLGQIGAVRITAEEVDGKVEISIADAREPVDGDAVVERDGATVYLDEGAAEVLSDQVLGVQGHDDHFHFTFDDQTPE
jgi:hypothetical protein